MAIYARFLTSKGITIQTNRGLLCIFTEIDDPREKKHSSRHLQVPF